MSDITNDVSDVALSLAWNRHKGSAVLTAEEEETSPLKLKEYIDTLVSCGENDPEKIARSALGLIREFEQIHRSEMRVSSPSIAT